MMTPHPHKRQSTRIPKTCAWFERVGPCRYELMCFLNNQETDTQAGVWCDRRAKEVIISFRGTTATWKDFMTDLYIVQEPLKPESWGNPPPPGGFPKDKLLVHAGFKTAFLSVREAVYQVLGLITGDRVEEEGWKLFVTGHSLGGALAVLMSYDLALRYPEAAQLGRLIMYSYGAPRVGSPAFCREYDHRHQHSFRIVNNLDLIARMPRATKTPQVFEYGHVGRTVLVNEELDGKHWVEGQHPGSCPLREVDPFLDGEGLTTGQATPSSPGFLSLPNVTSIQELEAYLRTAVTPTSSPNQPASLGDLLKVPMNMASMVNGSTNTVTQLLQVATNVSNLQEMVKTPSLDFSQVFSALPSLGIDKLELPDLTISLPKMEDLLNPSGWEKVISETLAKTYPMLQTTSATYAAQILGLNATFVNAELKLMESIIRGAAMAHHMEPLYYVAMQNSLLEPTTREQQQQQQEQAIGPEAK